MTDETETPATDHDTARPRVPNVRPGAVSGLDNVLLNPDGDAALESEEQISDEEPQPVEEVPDEPQPTNPDGSLIPTPDEDEAPEPIEPTPNPEPETDEAPESDETPGDDPES